MRVFLAEKPSQASDYARLLGCSHRGDGYFQGQDTIITWGYGHLLQPADPESYGEQYKSWDLEALPIIPEEWRNTANPKTISQLKVVKSCLKQASEVVIATDSDREGELIARLVLEEAKYNGPLKRLWLSALDDASISRALGELKDARETEPLYWSGLARQHADWLAGMNYTRACTTLYTSGGGNVMSVGRVQTPTLRLIVERDLEIENFKPKTYFTLSGVFGEAQSFDADWIVPEAYQDDEDKRCLKHETVEAVKSKCEGQHATVTHYDVAKKSSNAPLCMSISELQKKANKLYGYDLKQTLDTAQSLYEKHKATTYPRSSCRHLPLSQFEDAKELLPLLKQIDPSLTDLVDQCDTSFKSKCWDDKKVSEDSHHALIPTLNRSVKLDQMNEMERNVYDIIRRHYIAQFLPKYRYQETNIELECADEHFKTKGVIPLDQGWKIAFSKKENEESKGTQELPNLELGSQLPCNQITIHQRETTPPAHYNDETIVSAMENCGRRVEDEAARKMLAEVKGIGTGTTRSEIINTLKKRYYVITKGKSIISTDKGRALIERLPDELTSLEITADMEHQLNQIAKGNGDYETFMQQTESALCKQLELLKASAGTQDKIVLNPCPDCGNELVRRKSKTGNSYWWGCSNWKAGCKATFTEKNGKLVSKSDEVESTRDCPVCGQAKLVKRKSAKSKKTFWACKSQDCEALYPHKNGKPVYVPFNMELPSKPVKQSKPVSGASKPAKQTVKSDKPKQKVAHSKPLPQKPPKVVQQKLNDGEAIGITADEYQQAKNYYLGDSNKTEIQNTGVAEVTKMPISQSSASKPPPKKADKDCPECGEGLTIRKTKTKHILLCSAFPACSYKEITLQT